MQQHIFCLFHLFLSCFFVHAFSCLYSPYIYIAFLSFVILLYSCPHLTIMYLFCIHSCCSCFLPVFILPSIISSHCLFCLSSYCLFCLSSYCLFCLSSYCLFCLSSYYSCTRLTIMYIFCFHPCCSCFFPVFILHGTISSYCFFLSFFILLYSCHHLTIMYLICFHPCSCFLPVFIIPSTIYSHCYFKSFFILRHSHTHLPTMYLIYFYPFSSHMLHHMPLRQYP